MTDHQRPELHRLPDVSLEEITVEEIDIVRGALHDPEFRYRTISGIQNDTGLAPERISSVLVNTDMARRTPWVKEGETVFAASEVPLEWREKLQWFFMVLSRDMTPRPTR